MNERCCRGARDEGSALGMGEKFVKTKKREPSPFLALADFSI
jgi:hypothetical protein